MLQLRVQEAGEYQQPEVIMTAARAVRHMCTCSIPVQQHLVGVCCRFCPNALLLLLMRFYQCYN